MLVLFALDNFVIDIEALFNYMVLNFNALYVFVGFFLSELLMGIVPPELFIAWGLETLNPWIHMFFLAALSYISGIITYWFGLMLYRIPAVRKYMYKKYSNHLFNLRRWGGLFIFAGAMLPLPHALVSFLSGLIKFKFRHYLYWALFRFARFFIFALIMMKLF